MIIFHNPRCRKSREGLNLLEEKGHNPIVVEYLNTPPSFDELKAIILKLGIPAAKLIRKTEAIFKENFKGKDLSDDEWIKAMIEFPKLIERPIIINKDKAVVGRPTEKILDIL